MVRNVVLVLVVRLEVLLLVVMMVLLVLQLLKVVVVLVVTGHRRSVLETHVSESRRRDLMHAGIAVHHHAWRR